jgi:hypothetical protein
LAITVAACGGNDGHAGAVDTTTAAADPTWKKVVPGGACECADGSEFAFSERRNDPTNVVFYLDGGGTCFDAKTCAFTDGDPTPCCARVIPNVRQQASVNQRRLCTFPKIRLRRSS